MFIQDAKIISKIIFILPTLLGLLILIIAGSRGPFLNMMLLLLFLFYVKFKDSVSKSAYFFKSIFIILTLYVCLAFSGLSGHLTDRFTVFSRLNSFGKTIQKGEKEERNDIFMEAWNQFLSSPIIGDSWVTKKESFYPHNLYLDVLMSLGVIGMFIFLIINVDMMKRINFIVKRKEIFILPLSLVLINNFLTGLTSGGIAFGVDLWVLIALFVSFSFIENTGLPN